jgi:hypothetical protein
MRIAGLVGLVLEAVEGLDRLAAHRLAGSLGLGIELGQARARSRAAPG